MKRFFLLIVVLGLSVTLAAPAVCEQEVGYSPEERSGCQMMGPHQGMERGHGHGMGHGYMRPRGWRSMNPEQLEKCEKMRAAHLKDTLELRKQLTAKQMELQTLWAQPNIDQAALEKLSNEVAELRAQLWKKRDQYLMQCRKELGDQGWCCPGGGQ